VRSQSSSYRKPAGVGAPSGVTATHRHSGPRRGQHRHRSRSTRRLPRVPARRRWLKQPRREPVAAPMRTEGTRHRTSDVPEIGDRSLNPRPGRVRHRATTIQHGRDRTDRYARTADDVDQRRSRLTCGRVRGPMPCEGVTQAVAGARRRARPPYVILHQVDQPRRRQHEPPRFVLGWTAV